MCVRAADSNIASKEKELQRLLEVLRIHADTHVVIWDHLANMVEPGDKAVTPDYLAAVNEFIRVQCSETAVSFIYLPRPGPDPDYIARLERMTRNLPPTLLVHGVSPVITTTL